MAEWVGWGLGATRCSRPSTRPAVDRDGRSRARRSSGASVRSRPRSLVETRCRRGRRRWVAGHCSGHRPSSRGSFLRDGTAIRLRTPAAASRGRGGRRADRSERSNRGHRAGRPREPLGGAGDLRRIEISRVLRPAPGAVSSSITPVHGARRRRSGQILRVMAETAPPTRGASGTSGAELAASTRRSAPSFPVRRSVEAAIRLEVTGKVLVGVVRPSARSPSAGTRCRPPGGGGVRRVGAGTEVASGVSGAAPPEAGGSAGDRSKGGQFELVLGLHRGDDRGTGSCLIAHQRRTSTSRQGRHRRSTMALAVIDSSP